MLDFTKKNITDALEGVAYPHPEVIPDEDNKSKEFDTGYVVFDFVRREDLIDYVEDNGTVLLNTAFGITAENLYHSARKAIQSTYGSFDVVFDGKPKFDSSQFFTRIKLRYTVNLS